MRLERRKARHRVAARSDSSMKPCSFSSVTTWWGFSFTFEAPMPSFRESSQMLAVL